MFSLEAVLWIRIRIRISIWCGCRSRSGSDFQTDADPDPDSSVQLRLKTLKKCSYRLIVNTFWLVICKLMRIRTRCRDQLITLMRIWCRSGFWFLIDADPDADFLSDADADPGYQNDANPCGSGSGCGSTTLFDGISWSLEVLRKGLRRNIYLPIAILY